MKVELLNNKEGYQEVIELLNANHPDEYEPIVSSAIAYTPQSASNYVARVGNTFFEAETPEELYQKIVDHYFHIPHSFIG